MESSYFKKIPEKELIEKLNSPATSNEESSAIQAYLWEKYQPFLADQCRRFFPNSTYINFETVEDSLNTYEYDKHFIVYPQMVWSESRCAVPTGKRVPEGFSYNSGNNTEWLSVEQIRELLKTIDLEK